MQRAIQHSATTWGSEEGFPYHPFLLDDVSSRETSEYELDFTLRSVRYTYGFESDANGIRSEWLFSYPEGRKRLLFERHGPESQDINFGRKLSGENATISKLLRPNSLYLSTAANNNHAVLKSVWHCLVRRIGFAFLDEVNRLDRIERVKEWITDEDALSTAVTILKFADLGIEGVAIEDQELDSEFQSAFIAALEALEGGKERSPDHWTKMFEGQRKKLTFSHSTGEHADPKRLDIGDESSGTVSWLALAMPAVRAMGMGEAFVVDEIDASLHPRLSAVLISMFKDEELNQTGAQLIFTSHDTTLLGGLVGNVISHEDAWFVEKNRAGVSELYSLAEFPVRSDHNIERRYLSGRYGAVPVVSYRMLRDSLKGELSQTGKSA